MNLGLDPRQLLVHVVRPALAALGLPGGILAEKLVMGTAAQESGFRYLHQLGKGPALSLWQIEPNTVTDTLDRLPTQPLLRLRDLLGWAQFRPRDINAALVGNLYLGAAMCRLVYYMKPFQWVLLPLPEPDTSDEDVNWCAATWKAHYNTPSGAGTESQFIRNWTRFKLDDLWKEA